MNLTFASYRLKNQLTSVFAPSWTAKKASKNLLIPRRFEPKPWEMKAEEHGYRFQIDSEISAIRWLPEINTNTTKKILLVHGWESRATQMYGLVPGLLLQGYQVVAIDMPAHGLSSGTMSNAEKFVQTILLAQKTLGTFDAIIGHSMGAAAIGVAVARGLESKKLVLISGPSSFENVLRRFSVSVGLNQRATEMFINFIAEHVGVAMTELDATKLLNHSYIPTLLIHDQADIEVPISESRRLLSTFKNAELFVTERLGHRKILKSEILKDKINDFLICKSNEDAFLGACPDRK